MSKGEATTVVSNFIPPYMLMALSKNQLITEKIQALLTRKKARDFYDLYFILRANLLVTQEKNIVQKVLAVLKKTTIHFEKELKLFLPKSHWAIMRDFKNALEQEIRRSA